MASQRLEKVAEEIKKEVAQILQLEIKDPRIGFVTITQVRITPDLQHATVLFSLLEGHGDAKKTESGLKSASGYVRRLVGERLGLRVTPQIHFKFDSSLVEGFRMSKLLDDLKKTEEA